MIAASSRSRTATVSMRLWYFAPDLRHESAADQASRQPPCAIGKVDRVASRADPRLGAEACPESGTGSGLRP
jgi:hypothetical protein